MRNSILGWAGTLLGAVGLLLALSTVPATWVNQYQALDAFLIALTVLCLVIVVIVPLTLAPALVRGTRFRWKARQAARHPIPYHVDYRIVPTTATGARNIRFTTDDEDRRFVMTPGQAVALRITAPFEATVWASANPAPVRYFGKTIFTVTEFLPLGFVITDQSPGLQVDGEVSYSQLMQITPPPPSPAPEDSEGNQDQAAPGSEAG